MTKSLLEGSEAIAEAMVSAGCRFFAGYPMTPFTEVLEQMAKKLPLVGGTCMNAESELEAVGMAWGAAATGTLAATGSTGQGLSLMQESIAELALARIPLVVLNMGRAQGDYWQATRGGGHGDYRTPVLAPVDVAEAVELVQLAFHLSSTWRNPVVMMGDYFLAHTATSVDTTRREFGDEPDRSWALDGTSGGTGRAKLVSPLGAGKQRLRQGYDMADHYSTCAKSTAAMLAGIQPLVETSFCDDAEIVVTAFGSAAKYVYSAVREIRASGAKVGFVRPITLLPFPSEAFRSLPSSVREIVVYENNTGQMVDDVRLAVEGAIPVSFIGRISLDSAGFGIAPDLLDHRVRGFIESHLPSRNGVPA